MFNKTLLFLLVLLTVTHTLAEEKTLSVEISLSPEQKTEETDKLTLEGMKKALNDFFTESSLSSEEFWKSFTEKKQIEKLSAKDIVELLKPVFKSHLLGIPAPLLDVSPEGPKSAVVPSDKASGVFRYELDAEKTRHLYEVILSDLPDIAEQNFYLYADIEFEEGMKWEDVGVARAESFTGVIKESWLKMATQQFKGYKNYAVLAKELKGSDGMNPASVTLKWISRLKKVAEDPIKKSAKFELSAQYVLSRTSTNETIMAFDFPMQKKEFSTITAKQLSSGLASLIYNLLNSQASKISSTLEGLQTIPIMEMTEIKVVTTHGLTDIYQAINWLNENLKNIQLKAELKTYSSPGSILVLKSAVSSEKLFTALSANGGRMPVNEQKILLFNGTDKTFAIIPKDGNN